ncbi:hypothetical protein V7S43_006680 [Phytophthora oleae]|uniref:Uncharacterized protein n=1 Tax=Phytophthora oleae TaxID=2107226 RepID=A0ABD3FNZ7_9STRA
MTEDLMFILYPFRSTGTLKGIAFTTAGYLLYTMLTAKYTFDLHDGDIFACVLLSLLDRDKPGEIVKERVATAFSYRRLRLMFGGVALESGDHARRL